MLLRLYIAYDRQTGEMHSDLSRHKNRMEDDAAVASVRRHLHLFHLIPECAGAAQFLKEADAGQPSAWLGVKIPGRDC